MPFYRDSELWRFRAGVVPRPGTHGTKRSPRENNFMDLASSPSVSFCSGSPRPTARRPSVCRPNTPFRVQNKWDTVPLFYAPKLLRIKGRSTKQVRHSCSPAVLDFLAPDPSNGTAHRRPVSTVVFFCPRRAARVLNPLLGLWTRNSCLLLVFRRLARLAQLMAVRLQHAESACLPKRCEADRGFGFASPGGGESGILNEHGKSHQSGGAAGLG
jgi:hypothetical protein